MSSETASNQKTSGRPLPQRKKRRSRKKSNSYEETSTTDSKSQKDKKNYQAKLQKLREMGELNNDEEAELEVSALCEIKCKSSFLLCVFEIVIVTKFCL